MKKLGLFAACLLAVALIAFGIYYYRHRYVRSPEDLLAILPGGDLTTFYANVGALRQAGMLKLLTGTKVVQDREYEKFVHEVNFDYARDLDLFTGVVDGNQLYFVLQGRFDWAKLRLYPRSHGGSCHQYICSVPTSTPGRWVSYHLIQPDVLALAVSADTEAVNVLQPPAQTRPIRLRSEPVWLRVSSQLLKNPGELPLAARIFAITVEFAKPVVLAAAAAAEGTDTAFLLRLDAGCDSEATAETIRNQLEIQTHLLQMELKREGQQASASDLTGLLTSGSFQIVNKHVVGSWPVRYELLRSLQ